MLLNHQQRPRGDACRGSTSCALAKAGDASQPVLYVEFRKDGVPVDPGPWWAVNEESSRMMMRKTSLLLLGAAAGVAVTFPRTAWTGAPSFASCLLVV